MSLLVRNAKSAIFFFYMEHDNFPQFPFLTRKMLDFGAKSQLDFEITSFATVAANLSIRVLTKEGIFKVEHGTQNNGSPSTEVFSIHDIPIFISVVDDADAFDQGECYVKLSFRINGEIVMQLGAGYVHQQKALSWPWVNQSEPVVGGGRLKVITGADPAAGAEFTVTVPTNRMWKLLSVRCLFVAAAGGGTRKPHLVLNDGSNDFADYPPTDGADASQSLFFMFAPLGAASPSNSDNDLMVNIPGNLSLPEGFVIKSLTEGFAGGDNWATPFLFVEEYMQARG